MQPKTLLLLAVTVLALGAFIFFYEQDLPSTDERAELAKKVLRLDDDEVESVLIEWDDRQVRFERRRPATSGEDGAAADALAASSGDWRLTSPLDARADRGAVDALLSSLTGLESSRSFEDFDRAELGLADPRARVTLVAASGQSVLEIGAEVPASSDMVVTVAGGAKAYRVASSLYADLTKEPGEWRDKKLFHGLRSDVERLILQTGEQEVVLAKRGDVAPDGFWIESPLADRADEDRVNALLTELTGLRARAFLDPPLLSPESMGLEPPAAIVEAVLTGTAEPFRLELGQATEDGGEAVYGRADSQLFEVETEIAETVAAPAADWRSKSWTSLQVFEIEAARFEDASGTLEVSRDGADWQRGEDRIGYAVVSDLLYPIAEARAERVVERAAAPAAGHDLGQPILRIALSTEEGEEELELFPAAEGLAAATSGGREAVLLLAEEQTQEILDKLRELRAAETLPAAGDENAESEAAEPIE